MNTDAITAALSTIWARVYRASQLDQFYDDFTAPVEGAVESLLREWPEQDAMRGRAAYLGDLVMGCGMFAKPSRKLSNVEEIVNLSQGLSRYVEQKASGSN